MDESALKSIEGETGLKFAGGNIGSIVSEILPYIFSAAGIILLLYLIYGGISLMLSQGDPKAMQAAQAKITNAVIGFVVVFLAYWIVQIVGKMLGIETFGNIFK
jgi:hypothetical protein